MKKFTILFLFLILLTAGVKAQVYAAQNGATYSSLRLAFNAIHNGLLTGAIVLEVKGNTNETATALLRESGYSSANYTSVTIFPSASATISGNINGPLIDLSGADNVTIDGRIGQSGTTPSLIISNTNSTTTSPAQATIRFINDATYNTIKYCTIKGSQTNVSRGVIFFSTTTGTTGNDYNTIDNNNITLAGTVRPMNTVFSLGTNNKENSQNTISYNKFYDFFNPAATSNSNGIYLSSGSTEWTISYNSFYETTDFAPSDYAAYVGILIDNPTGNNFDITGNSIGGSSPSCGGTAWTKSSSDNLFEAIYLNVGTTIASSVQNNTISNFSWSNSASSYWVGIYLLEGDFNIGTSTGNIIGSGSGTGSIVINDAVPGGFSFGIYIAGTGSIVCQNNIIGSITTGNDALNATDFYGIYRDATSGTVTISYNTIGSTSTANSIYAGSSSTEDNQSIIGIYNVDDGSITITDNTIANLTNNTTSTNPAYTGFVSGVASIAGNITISNNSIHDLKNSNLNPATNQVCSVSGISLTGTASPKTVTRNTIYNLSNTNASFSGSIIGLYFAGNTGSNIVSGNFIHGLSVNASSASASLYGIRIFSGVTTYSNNIISLGGSTKTNLYGIYETGASGNNNKLYFNTVYIGGDGDGGTNKSYALYSAVNTNTRDFRNNIFFNARSTTAGSNLHYAAYIVSTGGTITCDYNDYLASGTYGSMLGFYGANKSTLTEWQTATGQDISSFAINPSFASAGGTVAANYIPSAATLVAVTGTGVTTDYDGGAARSSTYPAMGAFEYSVSPAFLIFTGSTSSNWGTSANWNYNNLPLSSDNVKIVNVTNDPIVNESLATPAVCNNLTIESGAVLTIAAGMAATVSGTMTNNGTLKLNSGSSAIASLKLGTYVDNGSEEIQLYLEGNSSMWHYISSPVTSLASSVFYYTGSGAAVTEYRENLINTDMNNGWVTSSGSHYNTAALPPAWESGSPTWSNLSVGYGYNYYSASSKTFTISGAVNTGNVGVTLKYNSGGFTPNLTQQGYNLIGNPFTCGLDWDAVIANNSIWSNVEPAIYFRKNGVTYSYINGHILPNDFNPDPNGGIIPPMQGFFIKSNNNNETLNIPASAKVHTANSRYKGESSSSPLVRLQINNSGKMDQTLICIEDKATLSYDNLLDARKIFPSSDRPALSSSLEGIEYSINAIPLPQNSTTIPLIVNANITGSFTIDAAEILGLEDYYVYLNDKLLNTTVNLSQTNSYSFSSVSGVSTDRFTITISNVLTAIPEMTISNNKPFNIYSSGEQINIQTLSDDWSNIPGEVRILDLTGKIVSILSKIEFSKDEIKQISANGISGIYLVEIRAGQKRYVGKVIIK